MTIEGKLNIYEILTLNKINIEILRLIYKWYNKHINDHNNHDKLEFNKHMIRNQFK